MKPKMNHDATIRPQSKKAGIAHQTPAMPDLNAKKEPLMNDNSAKAICMFFNAFVPLK